MPGPLEPELLAEVTRRAKKQIRARMRQLRTGHPEKALRARSEQLVERLLPFFDGAAAVALFWPLVERGEVDLRPLDARLRAQGVRLYYPFMEPTEGGRYRTGFRLTGSTNDLEERGQRFLEPRLEAAIAGRGDVDVVLVPALAADGSGHRIGYGAGYYDATLGDVCPPARSILVAYDFQLLSELPHEAHDLPCDAVVTDRRELLISAPK